MEAGIPVVVSSSAISIVSRSAVRYLVPSSLKIRGANMDRRGSETNRRYTDSLSPPRQETAWSIRASVSQSFREVGVRAASSVNFPAERFRSRDPTRRARSARTGLLIRRATSESSPPDKLVAFSNNRGSCIGCQPRGSWTSGFPVCVTNPVTRKVEQPVIELAVPRWLFGSPSRYSRIVNRGRINS